MKHSVSRCVAIDGSAFCSTCAAFPSLLGEKDHPPTSSKMFFDTGFPVNLHDTVPRTGSVRQFMGVLMRIKTSGLDFPALTELVKVLVYVLIANMH